jgi:hypothetical protein
MPSWPLLSTMMSLVIFFSISSKMWTTRTKLLSNVLAACIPLDSLDADPVRILVGRFEHGEQFLYTFGR